MKKKKKSIQPLTSYQIPTALTYNYAQGYISKTVFLCSALLYTVFKSHTQYQKAINVTFKVYELLKQVSLPRGSYNQDLRNFLDNPKLQNFAMLKGSDVTISIKSFILFCTTIQRTNKNIDAESFKKHKKYFEGQGKNSPYIKVDSNFFEYINANKLNKGDLRLFMLMLRKKSSVRNEKIGYDYLKEYSSIRFLHRIKENIKSLQDKNLIHINDWEDFDCDLNYLDEKNIVFHQSLDEQTINDLV